jgi:hypothetical protein
MNRRDTERESPVTGRERNSIPLITPSLTNTDSTCQSPLLKSLLRGDIIGFMGRFFVSKFPS